MACATGKTVGPNMHQEKCVTMRLISHADEVFACMKIFSNYNVCQIFALPASLPLPGASVGASVGAPVGATVGVSVGALVGALVGTLVGGWWMWQL